MLVDTIDLRSCTATEAPLLEVRPDGFGGHASARYYAEQRPLTVA